MGLRNSSHSCPGSRWEQSLFEIRAYIRKNKGPCRMLSSPLDVQPDCDDRTIVQPDITLIRQNERIARKGIYGALMAGSVTERI